MPRGHFDQCLGGTLTVLRRRSGESWRPEGSTAVKWATNHHPNHHPNPSLSLALVPTAVKWATMEAARSSTDPPAAVAWALGVPRHPELPGAH
eukprot:scaffold29813_cov52-Phaeocystis_antarctica.AAC.2